MRDPGKHRVQGLPSHVVEEDVDAIRTLGASATDAGFRCRRPLSDNRAMPAIADMTREEKLEGFLAPLFVVGAFALLGGIVHLVWIVFADASGGPLRPALIDRVIRWSIPWACFGFLGGIVGGIKRGGPLSGLALGVVMGLVWSPFFAVLGAMAATLWTWIDTGFWSLVPDLGVGIAVGALAAIIPAIAVVESCLEAESMPERYRTPYEPTPPGQLPAEERARIAAVRGEICTGVELLIMPDAGEEFDGDTTAGFVEVGWGLSLRFGSGANLIISWSGCEEPEIEVSDPASFQGRDSLLTQPVSSSAPWDAYVGSTLDGFESTSYLCKDEYDGDHPIVWGIELRFSTGRLLVGAVGAVGDFEYLLGSEQVLVVYDSELIDRCLELRMGPEDDCES